MKRPLFTILSALSLLLCVAILALWVLGHLQTLQVGRVADSGVERVIRVKGGMLVMARLAWRAPPRDESVRARFRDRVLAWPENATAEGLPAESGFYRSRRTFAPGHVFYGAGISEASVLRAPLLPFVLLSVALLAVRTVRWRARAGRPPISRVIPTRWKWIISHVVASEAAVAAAAVGEWGLPPAVWWVTAPASSCILLLASGNGPFGWPFVLAAYGASLAGSLWLMGAWEDDGPASARRGFDIVEPQASSPVMNLSVSSDFDAAHDNDANKRK